MTSRRLPWLASLLACGALIGGCGSSASSTTSSQSSSSTAASTPTTSSTTASTPSASTLATAPAQEQIAACQRALAAESKMPPQLKAKLNDDCVKAAHGDKAAIKQAIREVCEEVIKSSALVAGPARDKALAACKAKQG